MRKPGGDSASRFPGTVCRLTGWNRWAAAWHRGCETGPRMRRVLSIVVLLFAARTAGAAPRLGDSAGFRADAGEATTFLGVEMAAEPDAARVADAQHHAFLGDVLSVLENSPSPIATNTLSALHSGAVH